MSGAGGREHALAWKLSQDPDVSRVLCAPGNAGTRAVSDTRAVDAGDPAAVLAIARDERIDLTIVGPELPLDRGIVDLFTARGLAILGPPARPRSSSAARCSRKRSWPGTGSRPHATAPATSSAEAHEVLDRGELGLPIVVKADGLAAGKGVVVAPDLDTARQAIRAAMDERQFGDAGARVVLEECLTGPEVSFFALCDGRRAAAAPLRAGSQARLRRRPRSEHRRHGRVLAEPVDGRGARGDACCDEIVEPVLRGLAAEGLEYRGFLYVGLMLTCDGPKVIEFNVRFGDPEAQVVIPGDRRCCSRRTSAAAATGRLDDAIADLQP